jgi:kynurenine formamidase
MLELACSKGSVSGGDYSIAENCAILVGTGWGKHWSENFYLDKSPYFTYEAMKWLISKKPVLLGTDFPRWENLKKPEGFFNEFYSADILMLAPCVNLEKITKTKVKLTALPLRIPGTSSIPCRAVVIED